MTQSDAVTGQSQQTRRRATPAVVLLSLAGVAPVVGFWMAGDTADKPENVAIAAGLDGDRPSAATGIAVSGPPEIVPGAQVNPTVQQAADEPEDELGPEDAEKARRLIGVWEQERYGARRMTVKEDGTATMVIRPSGLWASMFGERIDLEMYWKVRDGHIDYGVSGGTPQKSMEAASSVWGDHWVEKIEALTDQELVLLDQSTSAPSKWTRVPDAETSDEPAAVAENAPEAAPEESDGSAD